MTESPAADDRAPGPVAPPVAPPAAAEQWRGLVAAVLARAGRPSDDPERALTRTTLAGIDVRPLYTALDLPAEVDSIGVPGAAPFVRGAGAEPGWDVRQRHVVNNPARANAAIRDDLANGVTSVWLGIDAVHDVVASLDGVVLDAAPVVLDAGPETLAAARALIAGPGGAAWRGNVGADPIGWAHRLGVPADLSLAAEAFRLSSEHPGLRAVVVDGTVFHDAGGTVVDELAITAAAGVAYLRTLTEAGVALANALAALEFRFAVTDDQFASMAMLRAARWMWNRVGELCGAPEPARGQRQHAVTSAAMMTRRDPYTNVLRTTVAGFVAAVGGAQAVTVAPFDQALGLPDPLATRIARNTQAVLHDEVSLARVADPGGGSFYVEALTRELARRAWDAFTALERAGGATHLGAVAEMVGASRDRRDAAIAAGEFPITGVNRFIDADEKPLVRDSPVKEGESGGLPRIRYAQADEQSWAT